MVCPLVSLLKVAQLLLFILFSVTRGPCDDISERTLICNRSCAFASFHSSFMVSNLSSSGQRTMPFRYVPHFVLATRYPIGVAVWRERERERERGWCVVVHFTGCSWSRNLSRNDGVLWWCFDSKERVKLDEIFWKVCEPVGYFACVSWWITSPKHKASSTTSRVPSPRVHRQGYAHFAAAISPSLIGFSTWPVTSRPHERYICCVPGPRAQKKKR